MLISLGLRGLNIEGGGRNVMQNVVVSTVETGKEGETEGKV